MRRRLESHLTEVWFRGKRPGLILRGLSLLFRVLRAVRLWAFRKGYFSSEKLPVPVIVVGNITVGGTGKTPLVIALANALSILGWRPGIISRGTGSQPSFEPVLVTSDSSPVRVGDEPLLIHRKTQCPTAVHKKRVLAAQRLLAESNVNVIISDDGLQHLALERDIQLVVHTPEHTVHNKHLLPAGPFRDPESALDQVNFVLAVGSSADETTMGVSAERPVALVPDAKPPEPGDRVNAVAAIGNPRRFFESLRKLGFDVIEHPFPDHYQFQRDDLNFNNEAPIVMTEKDAVKCEHMDLTNAFMLPLITTLPPRLANDINDLLHKLAEPS